MTTPSSSDQLPDRLSALESQLQHVLEASPALTYTLRADPDGVSLLWVSANVRRILGYTPEMALADGWWARNVHPEDRGPARAALHRLFEEGDVSHRYRFRHENGTYHWIRDDLRLVRDDGGRPAEIVGSWMDITDRMEAELARHESAERFRQLAENIDCLFWLYDCEEARMLYVNPRFEAMSGRTAEELYANPRIWTESLHPDDRERVIARMAVVRAQEYEIEYRFFHADESVRWVRTRIFPVLDERGEVYRVVGTTEDITTRKQAEADRTAAAEHYRRLVETSPYAIYALDQEGRFTEANRATTEILGRTAADLLGRHMAEVLAPEDLPKAISTREEKFSRAKVHTDHEFRVIRPSGERRLVHVRASLIEKDGVAVGTHGMVRDITEERAREGEMRLLAAALESLDEGVSVMRFDGQLLYANSTHARLLGYEVGGGALPNDGIFIPDEGEAERAAEIFRAVAEAGTWSGRVRRRRISDGRILPLDMILGRVDREGDESVVFNILRDLTEERQKEQQFRRVERLASVGTMVGGIAHELNNPLHAVRNFAELMLMSPRDEQDREALEFIRSEADRAAKVVADLRHFARQAQEEGRERDAVDLNEVVRQVVQVRRYALETRGIEIVEDLAVGLPPIRANRGEIEQVVVNLIANAEEAMIPVAGERKLVLRTQPCAVGTAIQVRDTGMGIRAEHLERIFDPFFTTKPPRSGTGLGLSLVHTIVHEHGGDILVESEVGKGTTFTIDLPRIPTSGGGSVPDDAHLPGLQRPLRLLLVDDEEAQRRSGVRYFTSLGHHIDAAAEGTDALRLLEGREYDAIISDLRMPGMGGEILLQRLREQGGGLEKRVVFVTGDAVHTPAARALSIAGVPVLVKPVDLEVIARAVEEVAGPAEFGDDVS